MTAEHLEGVSTEPHATGTPEVDEGRGLAAQWFGLLFAPAVFFIHLEFAYLLVLWMCHGGNRLWVHSIGGVAVALAAVGTFVAWRTFGRAGRESPGEGGGAVPRAQFLAICGIGVSGIIVLLLAMQWVAGFSVPSCV